MREITCYVYDKDDSRYVYEFLVTLAPKAGYTWPTVADMDKLEAKLTGKLHKTEAGLRRLANSSPFDLAVTMDDCPRSVRRDEIDENLQQQADQYDADSVRHLRAETP